MSSLEKEKDEIRESLERAYIGRVSNVRESIKEAQTALASSRRLGDVVLVGKSLNHISLFYMIVGENKLSLEASHEAINCFKELQDELGIADARFNIGSVYYKTDNYHSGLTHLVDCLAIYKKYGDVSKQARVHKTLGAIYEFFGDEKNAFTSYEQAISAALEAGDLNIVSNCYNPLSGIYLNQNNIEKAIELIENSIQTKTESGDIRGLAFAYYGRGKIRIRTQQFDDAESDFKEAERIHLEMGEKLGLAMTYYKMGVLYEVTGKHQKALTVLEQGRDLSAKHNITQFKFKCDYHLYRVHKQLGDIKRSLFHLEQYLSLKETVINTETLKVIENYELISNYQQLENAELQKAKKLTEVTNKALYKSEYLLKRTQKIGNLGSWVFKSNEPTIEWSDETYLMFGVPLGSPVTFDDFLSYVHEEDRDKVIAIWTASTKGAPYDVEYRVVAKGVIKWIYATAEFEFNEKGVFTSAVGIVKDITDHYTHLEDLRIAKEQAESASKAKSEFLANMSHEIRTPLNGIVGFSDLLVRTDLSDKQKKYTSVINQSANSLMVIVDSILDLSKVEAGKLELLEDKAELSSIATQVIELVSYKIQDEKLKIFLTAAPEICNSFYVDEAKVRQVLTILISNSSKFTEHGEIELRIESLGKPDDGRVPIRFSVRDTGIGIDPAHHLKIFEAFSQGNSSTTKRYGGTGLGLTIANGLLALMDSRLQMESQVGKGSLFYFDLFLRLASND